MMPLFCCPRTPKIERSLVHREPSWFWFLGGVIFSNIWHKYICFRGFEAPSQVAGDGGGEAPGPGV